MGDFKMPFGKYKGKKLSWIRENDKGYYNWLKYNIDGTIKTIMYDYEKELEIIAVNKAIVKIRELKKANEPVYYVNVHCVGAEYRMGGIHGVSLVELCGNQYYINNIAICKENYDKLYKILDKLWKDGGRLVQKRGLY